MKLRKHLLASSAALAICAATAQADASPFYISVLGGPNWAEDERIVTTYSTTADFNFDTGFVVGGAFGAHLDSWLRGLKVEIEAAYRRNDLDGHFTTSDGTYTGTINGHISNFSLMANAWYEIDLGSKVRPYIGAGAGWAKSRLDQVWLWSTGASNFSSIVENSGFAYQLGIGLNYEIMRGVDVGIGYRYFNGPNIAAYSGDYGPDKIDNTNHAVAVNLTIDID
jgi:OmpA-OmpF porin, OOP family